MGANMETLNVQVRSIVLRIEWRDNAFKRSPYNFENDLSRRTRAGRTIDHVENQSSDSIIASKEKST